MTYSLHGGRGHYDALQGAHPAKGPGTLFLQAVHRQAFNDLCQALRRRFVEYTTYESEWRLAVQLGIAEIPGLLTAIDLHLSDDDLHSIKAIFHNEQTDSHQLDFDRADSLEHFLNDAQARTFDAYFDRGHLTTHFQPVVEARHPEHVVAHECLIRGIDSEGNSIPPSMLFDPAQGAALLYHIDLAARISNIRVAALHHLPTDLFINVESHAIHNPERDLRMTVHAIKNAGLDAEQIVFDITHWRDTRPASVQQLSVYLHQCGYRTSLDDLNSERVDEDLMNNGHLDYLRLDRKLIHYIDRNPRQAETARRIITRAKELGARTVAEGIENRSEMIWAQQNGVDFLQGYYVGQPLATPRTRLTALAA